MLVQTLERSVLLLRSSGTLASDLCGRLAWAKRSFYCLLSWSNQNCWLHAAVKQRRQLGYTSCQDADQLHDGSGFDSLVKFWSIWWLAVSIYIGHYIRTCNHGDKSRLNLWTRRFHSFYSCLHGVTQVFTAKSTQFLSIRLMVHTTHYRH